eukprot:3249728-Pleurochrysis_carterae.AAC.2
MKSGVLVCAHRQVGCLAIALLQFGSRSSVWSSAYLRASEGNGLARYYQTCSGLWAVDVRMQRPPHVFALATLLMRSSTRARLRTSYAPTTHARALGK